MPVIQIPEGIIAAISGVQATDTKDQGADGALFGVAFMALSAPDAPKPDIQDGTGLLPEIAAQALPKTVTIRPENGESVSIAPIILVPKAAVGQVSDNQVPHTDAEIESAEPVPPVVDPVATVVVTENMVPPVLEIEATQFQTPPPVQIAPPLAGSFDAVEGMPKPETPSPAPSAQPTRPDATHPMTFPPAVPPVAAEVVGATPGVVVSQKPAPTGEPVSGPPPAMSLNVAVEVIDPIEPREPTVPLPAKGAAVERETAPVTAPPLPAAPRETGRTSPLNMAAAPPTNVAVAPGAPAPQPDSVAPIPPSPILSAPATPSDLTPPQRPVPESAPRADFTALGQALERLNGTVAVLQADAPPVRLQTDAPLVRTAPDTPVLPRIVPPQRAEVEADIPMVSAPLGEEVRAGAPLAAGPAVPAPRGPGTPASTPQTVLTTPPMAPAGGQAPSSEAPTPTAPPVAIPQSAPQAPQSPVATSPALPEAPVEPAPDVAVAPREDSAPQVRIDGGTEVTKPTLPATPAAVPLVDPAPGIVTDTAVSNVARVEAPMPGLRPDGMAAATPAPIAPQQVVAQLSAAVHAATDGTVELTLQPEELGRVRLALSPVEGSISVSILAERAETMDLIRRHLEQFSQDLRELGYRDVRFDMSDQFAGSTGQDRPDAQGNTAASGTAAQSGEATVADPIPRRTTLSDGLDIRI